MSDLNEIIKEQDISIGILTVPPEDASVVAETLIMAGIKGLRRGNSNVKPKSQQPQHLIQPSCGPANEQSLSN